MDCRRSKATLPAPVVRALPIDSPVTLRPTPEAQHVQGALDAALRGPASRAGSAARSTIDPRCSPRRPTCPATSTVDEPVAGSICTWVRPDDRTVGDDWPRTVPTKEEDSD